MIGIVVKRYDHFNRAMNKYISSKAQYEREMIKGGYVSFKEGEKLAQEYHRSNYKPYDKLSDRAMEVCYAAKGMADRKGNLKPSDRLLDGMKDCGVNFYAQLPKHYQEAKGGFDAAS